jgi:hypothetical protein
MIPNSNSVGTDDSETDMSSSQSTDLTNSDQAIALLAYQLWESRGCPEGSSETDWYMAEEEYKQSLISTVRAQAASA